MQQPHAASQPSSRGPVAGYVYFVAMVVLACSLIANFADLSFSVDRPEYQKFPAAKTCVHLNMNDHLGAEYFNIAQALRAGEGFADPFAEKTGPTAWMPPLLPSILAALLWLCDDNKTMVAFVVVCLQLAVLVGTGALALALVRRTACRVWVGVATFLLIVNYCTDFFLWFMITHDCWLVLLAVDLVVFGLCWGRPMRTLTRAAGWGVFGGLCALIHPIVAFAWGSTTLVQALRKRTWRPLMVAGLCAGLTLTPWLVRNYLVFGKWIPIKSNLAYELYQSHCLQQEGPLRLATFARHPYTAPGPERNEYKELGEIAFMEKKGALFQQFLAAEPADFAERVAHRFVAATLWYEPFAPEEGQISPGWVVFRRVVYPLPMLALLYLVISSYWRRLHKAQWIVIGVYAAYLLPFIVIAYYDRYGAPLLAAKVLLIIWALDRLLTTRRSQAKKTAGDITKAEVYQLKVLLSGG